MKKKKIKKIVIAATAVALLGTGGVFGVRAILAGRAQSVDVYPVSTINQAEWITYGSDMGTSGTVVSDVSQQVQVPDDKVINEVYVAEGDEVKIGDKLLTFDTTLLELDRELQELTVQEINLEIKSAEADLQKLRNTTPVERSAADEEIDQSSDFTYPGFDDGGDELAMLVPTDRSATLSQDTDQNSQTEAQPTSETQPDTQPETQAPQTEPQEPQTQPGDTPSSEETQPSETTSPSGEDDLIIDGQPEQILTPDDLNNAGASDGQETQSDAQTETETETPEQPKMNQSLQGLLSNIRVKEVTEQGEVLLADTAQQGETPLTVQPSGGELVLVPHFSENAEHHFAQLDTYVLFIKGLTLKEEKSGILCGTAVLDGSDYPEIGGYTLAPEPNAASGDVARLTLAFHAGLTEQHEIGAELADVYAEIRLQDEEVTGDVLIFRTSDNEADDIRINVERPQTQEETELSDEAININEIMTLDLSQDDTSVELTEEDMPGEEDQEPESEAETYFTQNVRFEVTLNYGTNTPENGPKEILVSFYNKEDTARETPVQEFVLTVPQTTNAGETPETETDADGDETQENGQTSGAGESGTQGAPSDVKWTDNTVTWNVEFSWPAELGEPDFYAMVLTTRQGIGVYTPVPTWEETNDEGIKACSLTMTYQEPGDSPIARLEPLEELDFQSGEGKKYYKGEGTKEDPFVFFCVDGAKIYSSFINWVLGFNEDGTERIPDPEGEPLIDENGQEVLDEEGNPVLVRRGYYVVLEIRESNTITGAFIRSVGLDGTIRVEYGFGPTTYWIFSSDTGIVKYEEEIPEDDPNEDPAPSGFEDDFWEDIGETYTAEELAQAIAEKEREIRRLKLDAREAQLKLKQYDKELEESTVTSSVNGYVKSVGGTDADSDAYMVVTSTGGLYLRTTVSELDLGTVEKGDVLTATSWETQGRFEATVTEISYYPTSSSNDYYYGGSNPNSSNYPVLAHIKDTDGISPYESVNVQFPTSGAASGSIYIPVAYVRAENGQSYVYKVDENGLLEKQYVRTGSTLSDCVEIKEGLSTEDKIAFPYGKSVKNGAKTKEVDDVYGMY